MSVAHGDACQSITSRFNICLPCPSRHVNVRRTFATPIHCQTIRQTIEVFLWAGCVVDDATAAMLPAKLCRVP